MTRFKLLAAAAAALVVADTCSAQVFRSGGRRSRSNEMTTVSPQYSTTTYDAYGQPVTYAQPMTAYQSGMVYNNPSMGVVQTSGLAGTPYAGTLQAGGYFPTQTPVVTSGGFVVPQQMIGGVVQTGAMSPRVVTTQVLAPEGSAVTLSGTPSDRTQGVRPFTSPPLDPNTTYVYRAKATWADADGKTVTRQKNVDVKAGQQVTIDLTKPDADATDDQKTTKQPD